MAMYGNVKAAVLYLFKRIITMRLQASISKNATSYYVTKSIRHHGKYTSKVVEKLGTLDNLKKRAGNQDPLVWAKNYVRELTELDKLHKTEIIIKYSNRKIIAKDKERLFNGGYLFLQSIYYDLKLHNICKTITDKYKFEYDLNSILSRLIFSRIIYPASKLSTFELSKSFIEKPDFALHDVYRSLDVIAKEADYIQAELYNNSLKLVKRRTGVLYYDCTNYFFEIEQPEGIKQYGYSKEHRPNPIVQMGLFMDGDGLPLAFDINPGNTNEQSTLKPLEKKILKDFKLAKFVVCTDAGLSSLDNRRFNNFNNRAFITTQSIKKLKSHLKDWALASEGWKLSGSNESYNLDSIDEELHRESIFYKERWINENNFEQRLIVTYSIKYREYLKSIRSNHIQRAVKAIVNNPSRLNKSNQNDFKRLINQTHLTDNGEVADNTILSIDSQAIESEALFDGFYAVCTNLEDKPIKIIEVNKQRWEIEECFRILKSEFKTRPVYLANDERIYAHFVTCFIALMIFRLLEKRLNSSFSYHQIIDELRTMSFLEERGEGYLPAYTRTDFTDTLHELYGFRTDYEILTKQDLRKIINLTKK